MLSELNQLVGLQVYTAKGIYVGAVDNVMIEPEECRVSGIYIGDTNPLLVDGSKGVVVPYRWIRSVGDIIVLNYFPASLAPKANP
ncbi:MAG: PRC-barrel domain-containing protein [Euryarchaeota archaeon]|nr:PRC-barrel domain-containing protein [Euryarchaeota archaeon]